VHPQFRLISIATTNTTQGFHVVTGDDLSLTIIYQDTATRLFILWKSTTNNIGMAKISGSDFNAASLKIHDAFLKVGTFVRATFIVNITSYTGFDITTY